MNVAISLFVALVVVGGFYLVPIVVWVQRLLGASSSPSFVAVHFVVSLPTGFGALGVVATGIVALQVSVRTAPPIPDRNKALGRQVVLEAISQFAGAVGFLFAFGMMSGWNGDIGRLNYFEPLGPFVVAALLAIVASDAAAASTFQLGNAVSKARAALQKVRWRSRHDGRALRSDPLGVPAAIAQVACALIVLPLLTVLAYAIVWRFATTPVATLLAAIGYYDLLLVSVVLFLALGSALADRDSYVAALYFWALGIVLIALTLRAAWSILPPSWTDSPRALLLHSVIAMFIACTFVGSALALNSKMLWSRQRGLAYAIRLSTLRKRVERAEAPVPIVRRRQWIPFAFAIALAPIALVLSVNSLSSPGDPDSKPHRRRVLAVSIAALLVECSLFTWLALA
jgi:hypothetical protein